MKKFYDVIIIGSGAAGFGTADFLHSFGVKNICIVTENINSGTSRNTGSDKQTYYKPDFCSGRGDSVNKMAKDLFSGGAMNGTDAIAQASNSLRCFMRLVEAGVPFPSDEYGRFIGYKTDHDNTARATSAGPLTSKYMTEKLEAKVRKNKTEILDGYLAVKLIVKNGVCGGVICLCGGELKILRSKAVIMCTGAPAAIFSRSVYPASQKGATGLAIEAGAELSNFQEWQFGIASTEFRWNLSGSFQQVIPMYVSVSPSGEKKEFLPSVYDDPKIFGDIFLKGYQWPFDYRKLSGSSRIDIFVFDEINKGNRVYLDFRLNPTGYDEKLLSEEAFMYLFRADSLGVTPYDRLTKLNPKAAELYRNNGIDLTLKMLEIDICAQHNNGGIKTDFNCETTVKNLFAVGEAAGHFGVYRPGGSALNDTQTGGLLAANYLSTALDNIKAESYPVEFEIPAFSGTESPAEVNDRFAKKMSSCAGVYRKKEELEKLLSEIIDYNKNLNEKVSVTNEEQLKDYFTLRQTNLSRIQLCRTELSSIDNIGSRGGCICISGGKPVPENTKYRKYITVTSGDSVRYERVTAIPKGEAVFEKLLKKS